MTSFGSDSTMATSCAPGDVACVGCPGAHTWSDASANWTSIARCGRASTSRSTKYSSTTVTSATKSILSTLLLPPISANVPFRELMSPSPIHRRRSTPRSPLRSFTACLSPTLSLIRSRLSGPVSTAGSKASTSAAVRFRKAHRAAIAGAEVTTLERTLIDVARSYNLDVSVPMIDDAPRADNQREDPHDARPMPGEAQLRESAIGHRSV